jgi:hypothetical protein
MVIMTAPACTSSLRIAVLLLRLGRSFNDFPTPTTLLRRHRDLVASGPRGVVSECGCETRAVVPSQRAGRSRRQSGSVSRPDLVEIKPYSSLGGGVLITA